MRKLLPFVLIFILVVVLAACKNSGDEQTTAPGAQTLFPGVSVTESTTAANVQNVANTYVLTTTPDVVMPSVPTTQFNIANESVADPYTTQPLSTDINFTVPNMTAPVVNSSALPSTKPASTAVPTSNSVTTTTKKPSATTTTNPMVNAKAVSVGIADVAFSGKKAIVTISGGNYKSNSTVTSVKVNGETYDNIPCRISSGNLDGLGNQQIVIDLSSISADIEEGTSVSGSVPAGFLRSKDNKTYNKAFSFSVAY